MVIFQKCDAIAGGCDAHLQKTMGACKLKKMTFSTFSFASVKIMRKSFSANIFYDLLLA